MPNKYFNSEFDILGSKIIGQLLTSDHLFGIRIDFTGSCSTTAPNISTVDNTRNMASSGKNHFALFNPFSGPFETNFNITIPNPFESFKISKKKFEKFLNYSKFW